MAGDVKALADALREHAKQCPPAGRMAVDLRMAAYILDPRPPTLHEDANRILNASRNHDPSCVVCANDTRHLLSLVRDRIEALPYFTPDGSVVLEALVRDDVLALFGDES